jgi:hypothetical protein
MLWQAQRAQSPPYKRRQTHIAESRLELHEPFSVGPRLTNVKTVFPKENTNAEDTESTSDCGRLFDVAGGHDFARRSGQT